MLTVAGKSSGRAHAETLMVTNYALEDSCCSITRAVDALRDRETFTREDTAMAKAETFGSFIMQERTRLQRARDKALQMKADIDRELGAVEGELAAIAAYEQAKGAKPGKRALAKRAPPKRTAAPRARRGEKRQAVLDVVQQHPPRRQSRRDPGPDGREGRQVRRAVGLERTHGPHTSRTNWGGVRGNTCQLRG
jgi:hypothetical protein